MQLTPHITLDQMTTTGRHPDIPNDPPHALVTNLLRTAEKVEEAFAILSAAVGQTILPALSYGYRSPGPEGLNAAVGSHAGSAHELGSAADMLPPAEIGCRHFWDILRQHPSFMQDVDQLIIERGCVHVGLPVPAHGLVARHELRTDITAQDGTRHYPLFGIWEAPHA